MIVEPDFLTHWKTQLLVTMVAEAADELCRGLSLGKPSGNLVETHGLAPGLASGNLGLSYAEPWLNPRLIQPEASPLWVLKLWAHCQSRKAWIFPGMTNAQLRAICGAPLPPERWRDILVECRWIECEADKVVVHEWDVVNASLVRSWQNGAKSGGRPRKGEKPSDNPGGERVSPRVSDREDRVDREEGTTRTREGARARGDVSVGISALSPDRGFQDLVADAQKKVCGVLGNKRKTLGDLGVRALGQLVTDGELPREEHEWEVLCWFYGLPHDDENFDLRGRFRDADKLAQNLMASFERAHGYAQKMGRGPGVRTAEKKSGGAPANWREVAAEMYPDVELPADWSNLPAHVREAIMEAVLSREKEGGAAA